MSLPPTIDPGGPEIDEDEQRWERLMFEGKIVGYRRTIGRATMFSKDGYGWSASPIEYDASLPEATFGGPSIRIYHGDIVEMPFRYDAQEHRRLVVLVRSPGKDVLYDPETGEVDAMAALWPPPHSPFAQRYHGAIWEHAELRTSAVAVLNALQAEERPGLQMVAEASAVLLLGVLIVGFAQWTASGEVGPITSLLGGFGATLVRLSSWRRKRPFLLSRRWSLTMTWRVALMCGVTTFVTGLAIGKGLTSSVGVGVAGVLFSGLLWILAVDIVAWRTGGYAREQSSAKRPGARWD